MEDPKQIVYGLALRGRRVDRCFERQQMPACLAEVLVALGEIVVEETVQLSVPGHGFSTGADRPASSSRAVSASTVWQKGLGQVRRRPCLLRGLPAGIVAACGQHDDRQLPHRGLLPHEPQHVDAVHVRHVEVEHEQRHRRNHELLDRLETARRFGEC